MHQYDQRKFAVSNGRVNESLVRIAAPILVSHARHHSAAGEHLCRRHLSAGRCCRQRGWNCRCCTVGYDAVFLHCGIVNVREGRVRHSFRRHLCEKGPIVVGFVFHSPSIERLTEVANEIGGDADRKLGAQISPAQKAVRVGRRLAQGEPTTKAVIDSKLRTIFSPSIAHFFGLPRALFMFAESANQVQIRIWKRRRFSVL